MSSGILIRKRSIVFVVEVDGKKYRIVKTRAVKKEKIEDLLSHGLTVREIVDQVGCSVGYATTIAGELNSAFARKIQLRGFGKSPKTTKAVQSVKSAKKEAWDACSRHVRMRDALQTTGTLEKARCCTCGKIMKLGNLQAGHWLPGRHPSVLFDTMQIHAQCYGCNMALKGNPIKYWHFMEKTHGRVAMEALEERDRQSKKFTVGELNSIRDNFLDMIHAMIQKHGGKE
jgi:hypothetical protein